MIKRKKQIVFIIFTIIFALFIGNKKLIIQPAFASQSLIDLLNFNPSEQTLIIYNSNTQDGQEIAEYYANAREINTNRICAVQFPPGLFAIAEEFMGARKHIIENCICNAIQEIHPDKYPSPCDISNLDAISAVSPITHIVLIKGIPTRIYGTSWPTDSQGPSLDYYLSISLYDHNDMFNEGTDGNIPRSSYYSSDTEGSKQTANGDLGYVRQIIPAVDKIVAYGRVEAMTKQRTFDLIDRTLVAENQGITGNLTVGLQTTPENSRTWKFFRDLTNCHSDTCTNYLIEPYSEWPYETCRTGGTANGGIPGEASTITMPRGMNIGVYIGNNYSGNGQAGFDGLGNMLKWHKTDYDCVELCKDFANPVDEQNCRDNSTDYFKEINTECVGAADGLIGWQYRSFPVQFMGFWPDNWTQTSSGSMFKTPPNILSGGAYQDADYTDDKYIRFGNDSKISNPQCTLDDGSVVDCPEKVGVNLRYYKSFSPYITIDGSKNYTLKFRYRNTATPSGKFYARLAVRYDGESNNTTISTNTVNLDSANEDWATQEFSFSITNDGATYNRLNIDLYSVISSAPNGFVDFDAVELFDDDTEERIMDINTSSFNDPYVNSTHSGDYASNAIERLGGIAWWGSASHHLTGGHAFKTPQRTVGAFYAGRSLGESIAYSRNPYSSIFYGDPLYRPSGVKIYLGNYWEEINNSDSPFEFNDENSIQSLRINAFHGSDNLNSTNWQVSICRENDIDYCDQHDNWDEYAVGTHAVYDYEILSNLTSLVADINQREEFITRLRVWNIGEEESALYSYSYFRHIYPYCVDNELTTGNNDGSSWENAFQSIADLNIGFIPGFYNSVYVKATETPYREKLYGPSYTDHFYLDATGIGKERGDNKAVFYGSDQISTDSWADEGNGVYSTTDISTSSKSFLDSMEDTIRGVYSVNGINDEINSLTMVNSQGELIQSNNNFYYAGDTLYIYLEGSAPAKPIEVSARDGSEPIFSDQKLYGGIFRFGKNGNVNNIPFFWVVSNCVFEYNAYNGFFLPLYINVEVEIEFSKNIFRNNGNNGISHHQIIPGFSPRGFTKISQNLIYNNDKYGAYFTAKSGYTSFLKDMYLHIYNNLVYNNQNGAYFYFLEFEGEPITTDVENYNNIFFNNTEEDLKVNDSASVYSFFASNNNFDPLKSTSWNIFAGLNNIFLNPFFSNEDENNFSPRWDSPIIDAGTNLNITTDFLGNLIYGVPDIGAYEYQPPYTIGTNDIPTTGSIRIYSDGKYRMKTASSTSTTTTFSITPASGSYLSTTTQYMDITIDSWLTTGTKNKQWTATSTSGDFLTKATSTIYTIGDLKANTYYQFKLDNTASTTAITNNSFCTDGICKSDENGQIIFTYVGGYSTHIFGLEEGDNTAPERSAGSPNSTLSANTTETTLSLTTNEIAICKYSTTASTDYNSMTAFLTTNSKTHSINITGLANNTNYNYYVKCQDTTGNINSSDYTISFSVKATAGGGIPIWMLNQTNQNQNQDQDSDDATDNNQDQNTKNNNSDKTIVEQIKQKVFSYSRSRLKSLFQEQDSAKDLKSELEKHYGENKIPVHKKHWHTIVNSYIYGNYPIQAIIQAIKFGGKTVHPTIPFSAWQKAGDYLEWIGR